MNLSKVKIRQIQSVANALLDADFGRPRTSSEFQSTELTLACQVVISSHERLHPKQAGDPDRVAGHLVFRKRYLDGKATLRKGDKIVGILDKGTTYRTVDYRVTEVRPSGHLPNPTVIMVFFEHAKEEREAL